MLARVLVGCLRDRVVPRLDDDDATPVTASMLTRLEWAALLERVFGARRPARGPPADDLELELPFPDF